ncbi:MAG: exopolyphosphatase [Bacteroidetes bacterium]|jgi:exopolyphosphatase/guanosine-5'-triphosphate,3'-diphosphate pyrophosphatase|nr:exopolyphosphatase [Bacteroidota bacterium]
MRIAAIDVGTNTAQLLVADVTDDGIERVHVAERFVRLGEGVDASGRIGDAALDRLIATLREHSDTAADLGVDTVLVAATSASRDAANRDDVVRRVQLETGLPYEILSGDEEATWSFAAATAPFSDLNGPCLVVDVGGGSTELVAGTDPAGHAPHAERAITTRVSLDIGCIRLTERYFSGQPPEPQDVDAARDAIHAALDRLSLTGPAADTHPAPKLIGTAGTASALARVDAGPDSQLDPLHGGPRALPSARVRHWRDETLRRTVDEILALHPEAMEGRAPVFPVGVLILDAVVQHTGADTLHVSPFELRHGLILRHLAGCAPA